ncbi:hypothetical protein CBR_g36263 [Chara braunii]|uniref:Integrase catalytic domain-containing protein n=1 Tax=Chara braunii TaxID=69332 RepID=A0A388LK84_CHABU|nr:hypothetical protein CBR_g36263 [Chara braunii]|eukprot:GBG82734.1 hypothetical protein CBR_g36263 [Chara braunii]
MILRSLGYERYACEVVYSLYLELGSTLKESESVRVVQDVINYLSLYGLDDGLDWWNHVRYEEGDRKAKKMVDEVVKSVKDESSMVQQPITVGQLVTLLEGWEVKLSNIPKVQIFHFKGDKVSEWLKLLEQITDEMPDAEKFRQVPKYVWWEMRPEVMRVVSEANDNWANFKVEMQRRYQLGDGLLTVEDLERLERLDFTIIGAFATAFEKMARKVPGLAEETQCAIFLSSFTECEGVSLTRKGGVGRKLTRKTIKQSLADGELDQVYQFQKKQQRQKRKVRVAAETTGINLQQLIADGIAQYQATQQKAVGKQVIVVTQPAAKTTKKGKTVEQVEEEDEEEEEEEPVKLTKSQRKARNQAVGGQGTGKGLQTSTPAQANANQVSAVGVSPQAQASSPQWGGLKQGSKRRYKRVTEKSHPVPVLTTAEEEFYSEQECDLIRQMKEDAEHGPCRINERTEGDLIIGEPEFLTPQEKALMVEVMKERHRAYAFDDDERGRLDVDKVPMIRIHTVPHVPWNLRGSRYPDPTEERRVVDCLDDKIHSHVADYSSAPYTSPWFCFIKPNGTLRWVQNLQRLNAVTIRDAGGLPNADALSESCAARPIISLIDLYSVYDQFPVYPPDRPMTAMHTPRGLIHMNVAPQGWTNVVAMVQRHMVHVMQTVSPHLTQPYIDDLAVKGRKKKDEMEVMPGVRKFVWDFIQDIAWILDIPRDYNFTASGLKSKHWDRNRADGLSRIDWDKSEGEAKEGTSPVDAFLDEEEDERLHINACAVGISEGVRQGESTFLAQTSYVKRPYIVIKTFEEEDPWGGKDVEWMKKLALAEIYRLSEERLTIEEEIHAIEARVMHEADVNFLVNSILQVQEGVSGSQDPVKDMEEDEFEEGEITEAFRAKEYDGVYRELGLLLSCEIREREASLRVHEMWPRFVVHDGHLFIKNEAGNPRRVICGRHRQIDVIAALHDGPAGGHGAFALTYAKARELYDWEGMSEMIRKYCESCVPCEIRASTKYKEPLHPRIVRDAGAVIHLDLLVMPPGVGGYNYIFDARDNLTGFVDGRVIRSKTGETLAMCIMEYFLRYPFVMEFVMDRGSEFTCGEVKDLLQGYGLKASYTTRVHPQANALVERGYTTLTNLLAKWTDGKENQWPKHLRAAFFVENITIKRSTKYAPATLWYGRHATLPIESFLTTWRRQDMETNLTFEELLDLRARQVGIAEERI